MPIKKLLSWLLPHTCILCGHPSDRAQDLCLSCFKDLPTPKASCNICASGLFAENNMLTCGQCLQQLRPFDATFALFDYKTPVDRLLLELKFNQKLVNARVLGELMTEKIQTTWYKTRSLPDVIIPIPLHSQRLRERGYNQAMEIARPIAKHCQIPINITACKRIKPTVPQATLIAKERETNVKQAFTTNIQWDNYRIAVLDDVVTTGNTIREFCHLLKSNGAKSIDVWCAARPQVSSPL
jgi:ComF family protein